MPDRLPSLVLLPPDVPLARSSALPCAQTSRFINRSALVPHGLKSIVVLATLGACGQHRPEPGTLPAAVATTRDTARIAGIVLKGLRPRIEVVGRSVRWTLEERMAQYKVPGASIAVIQGGTVAWARGVGLKEAGKPDAVTTATLFQAGSASKVVAATAMLRLAERGTLSLDADVNRYLTSWRVPESRFTAAEKVTLRRIVSHNAGFTVHGFRGYAPGAPLPSTIQILNGAPPANSAPVVVDTFPGAIGRYSGGGLMVIQQLLMDVTGRPFPELIRREVLNPAGMTRSTYEQPLPESRTTEAARGHLATGSAVPGGWNVMPEQAAAGLWTTATDLAKWAIAVADAVAGRSTALLSQDMATQMLTPQKDGFGLGPQISGAGRALNFGHSGANVGYRAHVWMFPASGAGVVILTNSDNGGALSEEVIRALAAELAWPEYAPQHITPVPLDSAALARIVGTYLLRVGPGRSVDVRREGNTLTMYGPQNLVQELVPESATRFVNPLNGWRFEFVRDASGRVTSVRVFHDAGSPPIEGSRTR
jgi:CubicO group peptidase (beta-lactamase class C family)